MYKDLLLIALVSVVWKSAHGTYAIDGYEDFDLFSGSEFDSFHYTSPDLGSPLYQSHFSHDFHNPNHNHDFPNLFSDRFHHQSLKAFPRQHDQHIHLNSPDPHLAGLHRSPQKYENPKHDNHQKSPYPTQNLKQERVEVIPKDNQERQQNQNQDSYDIAQVSVPVFQKSHISQEQNAYNPNSQSIKTVQTTFENDDEPRYSSNGFKPVSEPKRPDYVIQNISPEYDSIQQNKSYSNYKIPNDNFPIYDGGSFPEIYDQGHLGGHVPRNQEYAILPVKVNSEVFNFHGLKDSIHLPLNHNGHFGLGHQNFRFIKLNDNILSHLGGEVAEGLSNFFKSNQGQLSDYEAPKGSEAYPGKKSDDKAIGVEQKSVEIGLKSIADTYGSLDENAKGYDNDDKTETPDYSGAKTIVPALDLGQKSLDVGVKTDTGSKIPYDEYNDKPTDTGNPYPTSQVKVPDVEQKTVNVDVKDNSDYPASDYGNSKTNTEQESVEIDLKSSLGDSNAYSSPGDSPKEYDGAGSVEAPKYPSQESQEIKLEQKSVLEEKVYKDVRSPIETSQKDLEISSFGTLPKDDSGYKSETKNLKSPGYAAQSILKHEGKPLHSDIPNFGKYGNSRQDSHAQIPRLNYINYPVPSLGISRHPSGRRTRPVSFGRTHLNSGSPISPVYAARPRPGFDPPSPRRRYTGLSRPNLGRARQLQTTPGFGGNGYPEEYNKQEIPKYQEPVPHRAPPSRYPPFPSVRTDRPIPASTYISRGPKPLTYDTAYRRNLGGLGKPSFVDYASGEEEYPGIGEKTDKPSESHVKPITQDKPYEEQSSISDYDSKLSGKEYPGVGEAGPPAYSKTEVVGGRYPVQRPVKSALKTEPEVGGTKMKHDTDTEQKYLPITALLSDNKDDVPASKTEYATVKSPPETEPKVEQQQDMEYEALLAGPGSQSNAVGSSGYGFNKPPASSPLGYSKDDQNLPPMPYEFGYDLQDDEHGSQYRQEKMDHNGFLTGRYGFKDPEGIFRQVEYEASKDGFKVNKIRTNEPGTENQNPADVQFEVVNQR